MNKEKAFTPSDVVFAFQDDKIHFVAKKYMRYVAMDLGMNSWEYKNVEKILDSCFTRQDTFKYVYDIPQGQTSKLLKTYIEGLGFKYSKDLQKLLDEKLEEKNRKIEIKRKNSFGLESIKGIVSTDFDDYTTLEIYKKNGDLLNEDTESVKPEVVSLFRKFGWEDWFVDDLGMGNSFRNEPIFKIEDLEKYADQLRGIGLECEIDVDEEDLQLYGK